PILPPEILIRIFDQLSVVRKRYPLPRSLPIRNVCLTSHQFCAIAQPILSRNIRVFGEAQSKKILESEGCGKGRIEELILYGESPPHPDTPEDAPDDMLTHETAGRLIRFAGKLGLSELEIEHLPRLDARCLESAGQDLKSLDLSTSVVDSTPGLPWNFPFSLTHLSVRSGNSTPPNFLSSLLASSSLTSLQVQSFPRMASSTQSGPNLFTLPEFPAAVANVTHLDLQVYGVPENNAFSHFTSVTHIIFKGSLMRYLKELHDQLSWFPKGSPPTIKSITVEGLGEGAFDAEGAEDMWKAVMKFGQLKGLEEIRWKGMGGKCGKIPKWMCGQREVEMIWGDRERMVFRRPIPA
ncbi:hypothetical protein P7C70_g9145, partial [Phenoliferia sp. Uapishka_3]